MRPARMSGTVAATGTLIKPGLTALPMTRSLRSVAITTASVSVMTDRVSLLAEQRRRCSPRGASGGLPRSDRRRGRQHKCDHGKVPRIRHSHIIEQRGQELRQLHASWSTDGDPDDDHCESVAPNKLSKMSGRCADRGADTELTSPPRQAVSEQAEQPSRSSHECQPGKNQCHRCRGTGSSQLPKVDGL